MSLVMIEQVFPTGGDESLDQAMRRADAEESADHDRRPVGNHGHGGFLRDHGLHRCAGLEGQSPGRVGPVSAL